ncbi:MAG TPA: HAD family phosphatase [Candidatus Dormibacteraeota bacterium]|nr:HAD family phosphatase [Candidatus Dormibacteraeota bacterium]
MSSRPSQRTLRGAIFDLGGVMTEPLGAHRAAIDDPVQLDLLRFFLNEFKDVYHLPTGAHDLHLLETGAISDDEFFDRMTARYVAGGGVASVDARIAQDVVFGRGLAACGAMIDAVRQVKGAGYRTALLTNISRSGEAMWRSLFAVDELFDVVVDSSQVGLRKPDPAIFLLTCERLGLRPEQCLFVDDLRCNVDAAADLGMTTVQCRDPVAVADEVVEMLLGRPAAAEPEPGESAGR